MNILLDTCAIIWAISEPSQLSEKAKKLIRTADSQITVSAISCGEIACAVERNRIDINMHWKKWFNHYIALNNWKCFDISLKIIEEAYSLPGEFHQDPSDRIIVATARLHSLQIITADKKILNYPHVDSEW
ncbi:MAG: type II toxin-antitoxin system VapC family toxin [Spirochaetales bacterium]|nr:type II toxin-antitoxin system VapC family toxin [Spirochaetales bacterium]